ncbi:hypothetical protein BpHYR1_008568 [Brachionus plicatilis]|uniref:Uncharacterized protein n=1 Tax=Brachionus plicatilis TaxID=10195 RepID=A0A3M7PXT3_BRAPC|nr:hypothetical protein BpHYR1_008568 [Brachionus plicatilis]
MTLISRFYTKISVYFLFPFLNPIRTELINMETTQFGTTQNSNFYKRIVLEIKERFFLIKFCELWN